MAKSAFRAESCWRARIVGSALGDDFGDATGVGELAGLGEVIGEGRGEAIGAVGVVATGVTDGEADPATTGVEVGVGEVIPEGWLEGVEEALTTILCSLAVGEGEAWGLSAPKKGLIPGICTRPEKAA